MKFKLTYLLLLLLAISSCRSRFQKLLRGNDYNAKYEAAIDYYNKGDNVRAYQLFESIEPIYKGTEKDENICYYISKCYFNDEDYIMSSFRFKHFVSTFPNSNKVEECRYKAAYSYYKCSPKYTLDQDYSKKAIEEFQMYLNKFPAGNYVKESNDYIFELRRKLEKKAYKNAKLYFDLEEYKAAGITFKNFLNDYPDSDYREEVLFLIVKSGFLMAENSVKTKQFDRYENVISDYYSYIDEYPNGKFKGDVEKLYNKSQDFIAKAAR